MAQTLRLKRSSVAGRVPTTATLQTGEIAINTADGLVYIRKDDDSIIPLLGVNTAAVTGDVILIGSIEATSFTGSFSGSFNGPITGTLSKTIGSGDGIVSFLFDGSDNVTVSLNTGSAHFIDGVNSLISVGTALSASYAVSASYATSASYAENAGAAQTALTASYTLIAQEVLGLETGSFVVTGSISDATITLVQAVGTSFELTVNNVANAISASHAVNSDIAISASYASFATSASYAQVATSASHAELADNATSASYALTTTSASFSIATVSASHALIADDAISASYAAFATTASYSFYAVSASHAELADNATTASYALFTTSASYAQTTDTAISASYATSASHALIANYALNANVETGSLLQTGSIVDATITLTKVDGTSFDLVVDNVASASYAAYAANVLNPDTGSFMTTGSVNNATLTFTKADESVFDLTVDNVANATSASYALYAANVINPNTGSFVTTGSVSNATITFTKADQTTFNITINNVESASYAATASSADAFLVRNDATVKGDLTVDGTVTAREFHTTFISASIIYESGSNKFGDTADDTHEFTGSILVSGSIDSHDISINDWGSVSASLATISASAANTTLQQVTDNGNSTTLVISASNLNITGFPDVSASLAELYDTSASFASELTLVSATASAAYNYTLQDITDNGNSTTLVISSSNLNITGFPDVSASLAAISSSAANAYGLTLQQVTDNGNQTTNHVSISSSLNVSQSIYSKGEEVLDFAVAMAIALG